MALISVVVLNWNGGRQTVRCLKSIFEQNLGEFEVLLVDNASSDNSVNLVRSEIIDHRLKVLINKKNLGFAAGMNIGIESCSGEYVVLLNQDIELDNTFLANAVKILDQNPGLGMVGGTEFLLSDAGRVDLIVSGGGYDWKRRIQGLTYKSEISRLCFGPHGSFPVVRMSALREVKNIVGYYYDTKFGTGWEDMDLWFRLHWLGWDCLYSPLLKAWHEGSGSVGAKKRLIEKPAGYQIRVLRNRYFVILKNLSWPMLVALGPFILLAEFVIPAYYLIGSPQTLRNLLLAQREVWHARSAIISDRRKILASRRHIDQELLRFFKKF